MAGRNADHGVACIQSSIIELDQAIGIEDRLKCVAAPAAGRGPFPDVGPGEQDAIGQLLDGDSCRSKWIQVVEKDRDAGRPGNNARQTAFRRGDIGGRERQVAVGIQKNGRV